MNTNVETNRKNTKLCASLLAFVEGPQFTFNSGTDTQNQAEQNNSEQIHGHKPGSCFPPTVTPYRDTANYFTQSCSWSICHLI